MGTFHVEIEVGDPEGRRYDRVELLVDTGATCTSLPCPLIEALGLVPPARERFVLADGREVERDIGRAGSASVAAPRSRSWCSPIPAA